MVHTSETSAARFELQISCRMYGLTSLRQGIVIYSFATVSKCIDCSTTAASATMVHATFFCVTVQCTKHQIDAHTESKQ